MQKIKFYFHETPSFLRDRTKLRGFLDDLFIREKAKIGDLTYVFCSDKYLLRINKRFLNHDYYTDIITFNLSTSPAIIIGEIYISINRVTENAKLEGVSFKEEIHRVIFHGALHLCGYNDKKAKDRLTMTAKENKYLRLYFKRFHVKHGLKAYK